MIIDWQVYPWHGAQSLTLGCILNWTSRPTFVEGRQLALKVITSQYRTLKLITSQYRKIKVLTLGE